MIGSLRSLIAKFPLLVCLYFGYFKSMQVTQLRSKIQKPKHEYDTLLAEVKSLGLWEENDNVADVPLAIQLPFFV